MSGENNGKILSRRDFLRWASAAGGAALPPQPPRPLSRLLRHRNTQA